MPLPAFLSSSYQQYKEDQKVFTTWLYQAAKACGYKSTTVTDTESVSKAAKAASPVITAPSQRLKGKARKLAKNASPSASTADVAKPVKSVTHMMSIAELTARVQAVSQSGKRFLPAGVESVLKRAITARQRCADWYAQSGANVAANAGHRHFINILKKAVESLSSPASKADSVSESSEGSLRSISNQFEALNLEDIDEEFPFTAADVSTPSKKTTDPRDTYQIDDSGDDFDRTFQLFCFFEDVHAIQADIQGVWKRFDRGELDLKVAMIITQAGINMVKGLERDQAQQVHSCKNHYSRHPHINLALPVYYEEAFMNGLDPEELLSTSKGLEHRPFDDFIYLPTLRTLMKFADISYKCKDKMRFSYISRPELLEEPGYKQLEEDDRILTQLLLDTFGIEDAKRKMTRLQGEQAHLSGMLPDLQDEFSKSARTLWQTGTVNTYAVFASRVVLDILDICGKSKPPAFVRQLRDAGKRAEASLGFSVDAMGRVDTGEVRWLTKDVQPVMSLNTLMTRHIPNEIFPKWKNMMQANAGQPTELGMEDMPPEARAMIRKRMIENGHDPDEGPTKEHQRNAKTLNLSFIKPAEEGGFLETHNALYCGAMSLRLTSLLEEAGVSLANHHLSIFAVAHFYNALRQLKATDSIWPDMERIIELQSDALFAKDIPKTPEDCYQRMAYRTGMRSTSKAFNTKLPYRFRAGTASASLRLLIDDKDSVEHALLQLEAQVDEHQSVVCSTKSKQIGRKRQLTPKQLISRFQRYLPEVLKDMEINYIALTKTCNALMKSMRLLLDVELGLRTPVMNTPGDSNDHSVVVVILHILDSSREDAAAHQKARVGSPFKGSLELQTARRAYETFWNKHLSQSQILKSSGWPS